MRATTGACVSGEGGGGASGPRDETRSFVRAQVRVERLQGSARVVRRRRSEALPASGAHPEGAPGADEGEVQELAYEYFLFRTIPLITRRHQSAFTLNDALDAVRFSLLWCNVFVCSGCCKLVGGGLFWFDMVAILCGSFAPAR